MLAAIALLAMVACSSRDSASSPPATGGETAAGGTAAAPAGPPAPPVPAVSRWVLDPENSSVTFVCKHVRTNVRGMFALPAGTVTLDDTTPANSRIDATIDPRLISTGVEERDTHLKGVDFFDVVKFPTITFASTSVARSNATTYTVTGDLTMLGVTRSVTLAVTAPPAFEHAGGIRRGISATTIVNRKDFGLAWDFPGEGPGVVVGDNIAVTIDAEMVLQPD